jgi:hypothetical protein
MPNEPDYTCTRCGQPSTREGLTVKKVAFLEMGTGARTHRSRVLDWLCSTCLRQDPDWNREPFQQPDRRSNA